MNKERPIDKLLEKHDSKRDEMLEAQAQEVLNLRKRCKHKWIYIEEDRHDVDWWTCSVCDDTQCSRSFLAGMPYPKDKL